VIFLKPHLYIRSAPSHGTMAYTKRRLLSKYVCQKDNGDFVYRRADNLGEKEHACNDKTATWLEKWRLTWILESERRGIALSFSAIVWAWGEWGTWSVAPWSEPAQKIRTSRAIDLHPYSVHVPGVALRGGFDAWYVVVTAENGTTVSVRIGVLGRILSTDAEKMHADVRHGDIEFKQDGVE
jgi:hypothetical protein